MDTLSDSLAGLESEHARALGWFVEHEGDIGPRPWRRGGESVVAGIDMPLTAHRGIHRPAGWDVALSVAVTTASAYRDGQPTRVDDHTWVLPYREHSGADGSGLDSLWNHALFENGLRRIPVGVFVPAGPQYQCLGLAFVDHYDSGAGVFLLRGPLRWSEESAPLTDGESLSTPDMIALEEPERVLTSSKRRVAQGLFRDRLLDAYDGRCAMTGYDVPDSLQGAHILEYRTPSSQRTSNGLLLRADVHILFDRHLLSIEPDSLRIRLAPSVQGSRYDSLQGESVSTPADSGDQPCSEYLAVHWAVFEDTSLSA